MEQVCTSCLPPLPTLDLHIYGNPHFQHWQGNIDNALWLRLLHPFTSVENLYLSEEIARRIVPALQELVGVNAMEVLPALQNIFLEDGQRSGPVQEGIQRVVAVRQATNYPIAVFYQPKLYFYDPCYLHQEAHANGPDADAQHSKLEEKRSIANGRRKFVLVIVRCRALPQQTWDLTES
ncbi:hypothetical protein BJV77DRAFT_1001016, partial [Russula vinacea]